MEKNSVATDLSIVIPVYNTPADYLGECLSSIAATGLSPEIILANDGSQSPDTLQFLQQLGEEYKVLNLENGGASYARNHGISHATRSYIFCLDSDDRLHPENFPEAWQLLARQPQTDVLYSDYQNFGDRSNLGKSRPHDRFYLYFSGNYISMCSFFKKEVWEKLQGFDERMKVCEDYDFWVRASLAGFRFTYFPKPAFLYRRILDGKSLSQAKSGEYVSNKNLIKSKITLDNISRDDLHCYFLNSFKNKRINAFKLLLTLVSPKAVGLLIKAKIFKSKYFID